MTERGLRQARWWGAELALVPFEQCYCSDLIRARQTAVILAASLQCEVEVLTALREINLGEWDGLSRAEVCSRFPGEWEKRGRDLAGYRPQGGESFDDLAARVLPVFEHIRQGLSGNALIVAHAGVNRVILCRVLGMPLHNLFRLEQGPGALSILHLHDEELRLAALNRLPPGDL